MCQSLVELIVAVGLIERHRSVESHVGGRILRIEQPRVVAAVGVGECVFRLDIAVVGEIVAVAEYRFYIIFVGGVVAEYLHGAFGCR